MISKWAIAAIAVIAALAGWAILSQKAEAPDVTVVALDGKQVALKALRGNVVLVNFWATTCTTCVGEMPKMIETYKSFAPRGYQMVAIAMDYDRPDWVLNFAKQHNLPFPVALDPKGEAERAFGGIRLTPTSFLIDKHGRIVQRYLGQPDFAALNRLIGELLEAS